MSGKKDKELKDRDLEKAAGGLAGARPGGGPRLPRPPGSASRTDETLGEAADVEVDSTGPEEPTSNPSPGNVTPIDF